MYNWNDTGISDNDAGCIIQKAVHIVNEYNNLEKLIFSYLKFEFPEYKFEELFLTMIDGGKQLLVISEDRERNRKHYFTLEFTDNIYLRRHRVI